MKYDETANIIPKLSSSVQDHAVLGDADNANNQKTTKSDVFGSDVKFVWPSGAYYIGDVVNGQRNGTGKQSWPNGAAYNGGFLKDMRHGFGKSVWESREQYEGEFFKDHRHGSGIYRWPDGSEFHGTFYMGRKEGFGKMMYANGDIFEGLYKKDERCGPGIVTYKDTNKQDIGMWHKEKLIRLCSEVEDLFTIRDHPEYLYFPVEHFSQMMLRDDDKSDSAENLAAERILRFGGKNLQAALYEDENFLPDGIEQYCRDFEHLPVTSNFREALEKSFFKEDYDLVKSDADSFLLAKNNTPLLMDIQCQIYKHRHAANAFENAISTIEGAARDAFSSDKGGLEIMSEKLIKAATNGDAETVYSVLRSGLVNPNVCDSIGNTALLGAAINCHTKIVNLLLDMGANIDQVTDEGVTALNACFIFYYPSDHFKENIAERYVTEHVLAKRNRTPLQMLLRRGGKRSNRSGLSSPIQSVNSFDERDEIEGPQSPRLLSSPQSGFDKKAAMECCRSDIRIKARYREISSARQSVPKRKLDTTSEDGADKDDSSSTSDVSLESESVDTSCASRKNLIDFYLDVPEDLIDRTATLLSRNQRAVSGMSTRDGQAISLGTAGALAVWKAEHEEIRRMIGLLLQRGASANKSGVPMYPIFFAVKAGDTDAIRLLLLKGASTEARVSSLLGGFTPLHIASAIPGKEGVLANQLLLKAGANPNVTAQDEDITHGKASVSDGQGSSEMSTFKKPSSQWVSEGLKDVDEGGRTPLHIACDRDDDYKLASQVVHDLLDNGTDPDVIWSGHSPLSLAVASGNDLAIDELLKFGADASLPLKRGVGNVLCAAANTQYEHRRTPEGRIKLVDNLVNNGASMLSPIVFGPKQVSGTVVDYAHWMFGKDARIAHTPYHALSYQERDTYNARKKLLSHFGNLLREAAVKAEREKLRLETRYGIRSVSPSRNEQFLYTGAGAESLGPHSSDTHLPALAKLPQSIVNFKDEVAMTKTRPDSKTSYTQSESGLKSLKDKTIKGRKGRGPIRKPLFRYCYECGRSVGVRLTPCSRCKEVYYCSRSCKLKAWDERHKIECLRIKGDQNRISPSPEQIASYFTVHTLKEAKSDGDTQMDSVKILPKSIVRSSEFLPAASLKSHSRIAKLTKSTAKTKKKTASLKSFKAEKFTRGHKSFHQKAQIGTKMENKVGKEAYFGTTGMTLAELGIKENYSLE